MKSFGNVVRLNHTLLSQVIKPGMTALDATCGNGYDSIFLASLLKDHGSLTVMDIQPEAIQSTAKKLAENGFIDTHKDLKINFIQDSHNHIDQYFVASSIDVCIFNLGYLPGGDKTITTEVSTTLEAVKQTLICMKSGGILVVICYPGHSEGMAEKEALTILLNQLPQKQYDVSFTSFINQRGQPPVMWLIEKKESVV